MSRIIKTESDYENALIAIEELMDLDPYEGTPEAENLELQTFLGSRSKVSEVLSRKRQLTMSMIRALHKGLGISAEVNLQERNPSYIRKTDIDWG